MELQAECKLKEAYYFLELLAKLESDRKPLTSRYLDDEGTYLASALMSACASVLYQLRTEVPRCVPKSEKNALKGKVHKMVQQFRDIYPDEFAYESGRRDISTHTRSVPAQGITTGEWDSFMWDEGMEWDQVKSKFVFSDTTTPGQSIVERFRDYILKDLSQLITEMKQLT